MYLRSIFGTIFIATKIFTLKMRQISFHKSMKKTSDWRFCRIDKRIWKNEYEPIKMAKKRGDGGRKHGDDCRNGDWDHQGGIQHWDKQTNVIQKSKHGILCLEHEPSCCQSKWCWPVGCKQKLGGLSLNHLRPEVEWRSYFDKNSAAGESTTLGPSCTCYCCNLLLLLAGIHSNFWGAL